MPLFVDEQKMHDAGFMSRCSQIADCCTYIGSSSLLLQAVI